MVTNCGNDSLHYHVFGFFAYLFLINFAHVIVSTELYLLHAALFRMVTLNVNISYHLLQYNTSATSVCHLVCSSYKRKLEHVQMCLGS
jgi:hypothetical protein